MIHLFLEQHNVYSHWPLFFFFFLGTPDKLLMTLNVTLLFMQDGLICWDFHTFSIYECMQHVEP